jgi:hypothetical protein
MVQVKFQNFESCVGFQKHCPSPVVAPDVPRRGENLSRAIASSLCGFVHTLTPAYSTIQEPSQVSVVYSRQSTLSLRPRASASLFRDIAVALIGRGLPGSTPLRGLSCTTNFNNIPTSLLTTRRLMCYTPALTVLGPP